MMNEKELNSILKGTRLRPRMQEAMVHVFVHGKTQAEAARLCNVSRQAVNYAAMRIEMKVRQNMP